MRLGTDKNSVTPSVCEYRVFYGCRRYKISQILIDYHYYFFFFERGGGWVRARKPFRQFL